MSLFTKIFITISFTMALFFGIAVSYIIFVQGEILLKKLNNKIEYNNKFYTKPIAHALYDINDEMLSVTLNTLYLDEEIIEIQLTDTSSINDITLNSKKSIDEDLIITHSSLSLNSLDLGELKIVYTKDIINTKIREIEFDILKFSIFLYILLLTTILSLIYSFTKPIKQLIAVTTKITSGNLDSNINIHRKDEIGLLANKFKLMQTSIKNQQSSMKQQLIFRQLLMDTVNTPIFIKDNKGLYIDCNRSLTDFYGKEKTDIIGKKIDYLFEGKDIDFINKTDEQLLKNGGSDTSTVQILNGKKEFRDIVVYKNTYKDNLTDDVWIVGTYFDITDINKAKDKIEKFNVELQQRISERTKELEDSNDELAQTVDNLKQTQDQLVESEKMASLGGLVAGIAHEINTPVGISLTAITYFITLTQTLQKDFENENLTEEDLRKFLSTTNDIAKQININIEKTAHLIRSFKQVSVDQTSENKRDFNLHSYLKDVLFSLETITKKENLKIFTSCDEDINILSYPGFFSQIITNLITNSIRHGYKNKYKTDGIISIKVEKQDKGIKLVYKDDGKGISSENLHKIFDPFFTTNREKGGIGLGLNIIYNIITTKLNGSIVCNSKEHEGVEFIITIKDFSVK